MSPRVKRAFLVGILVLAVGCLGVAIGKATSTPAACRDAVIAVDRVFEADTALGRATQDEQAEQMAEVGVRAGEYSALRAECLG